MKIWFISDTHALHNSINVPKNVDTVIHAGDSTNYYDWLKNQIEFEDFINWFSNLPIKHKVLIAGNHDAWAMKPYNISRIKDLGIIYLEHGYCEIDNKLIFGSPYTPTFGNWYFMKDRSKLSKYWEDITDIIDILITHGPPKGILDLSHNQKHELEYCGDTALRKAVFKNNPKIHIFGHIHDSKDCFNSGYMKVSNLDTLFINASTVTDNRFNEGCTSHGQIFNI
jgi:Icc-related predicted phosphoesterase